MLGLLTALIVFAGVRVVVGTRFGVPEGEVLDWRLLRLLAACAVGAALGVAGMCLQTLVRNPLASPELLGVSAGAGFASVTAAWLMPALIIGGGRLGLAVPAVLGASASLGVVYALSRSGRGLDPVGLVLVGVIIAMTCGSGTRLAEHVMPPDAQLAVRSMVAGHLSEDVPVAVSVVCLASAVAGGALAMLWAKRLDAMCMSDEEALSVGVNVALVRTGLFLIAGVLTAMSVVVAGSIGLVGLIGPHAARLLLGPRHRTLAPGAAVCGAILVIAADTAVAAVPAGWGIGRPPIGVLLTLIGGPVFIVMLRRELSGRGRGISV